jgi:glutaredoxin
MFHPWHFFLLLLMVLLSYAHHSEAQIYKWVDKSGVTHFGQMPPQGAGNAAKMEATLPAKSSNPEFDRPPRRGSEKTRGDERKAQEVEERSPAANRQVAAEMYSTSWCGYCRKAREYFQTRGIRLIEYDIEADPSAAERKRQIDTRPGVPLVVINGQLIHGYAPALYEQALARQR